MDIQIIDTPFAVNLVGRQGPIEGKPVGDVGKCLMDAMRAEVRARGIRNTGINHWVYLPGPSLFAGVELAEPTDELGSLERLGVELKRFLRHVHQGPYDKLPAVWQRLTGDLAASNETRAGPCLEIYGHWNADSRLLTTTILIGLAPKHP
jgi:hypothetical protein